MSPQKPASCGWPRCTDRSIDGLSRTDVDETGAAHNPKVAGSNPAPALEPLARTRSRQRGSVPASSMKAILGTSLMVPVATLITSS